MKTLSPNSCFGTECASNPSQGSDMSTTNGRSTEPLVSIVIGNYNGKKYLPVCLDSIRNQSYDNIEVIFVDDNSRDDSAGFVAKNHSWVRVVQNVRREEGYGACCDTGARLAKGKYMC